MRKTSRIGAFIFDTLILLTLVFFLDSSLRITEYRHILSKSIRFQSNQAFFTFLYSACQITAYLMNRGTISPPSPQYYNTILQGYRENGLDESYLETALENSLQQEQLTEEIDEDYDLDDDLQLKF